MAQSLPLVFEDLYAFSGVDEAEYGGGDQPRSQHQGGCGAHPPGLLHLAGPPGPLLGQFVETAFERLEPLVHYRRVQRPRLGPAARGHQPEFVLDPHPIDLEVVSDHGSGVAHAEVLQPVQFGVRPGDKRRWSLP